MADAGLEVLIDANGDPCTANYTALARSGLVLDMSLYYEAWPLDWKAEVSVRSSHLGFFLYIKYFPPWLLFILQVEVYILFTFGGFSSACLRLCAAPHPHITYTVPGPRLFPKDWRAAFAT